jgi:hypothetical protein
MVKAGVNGITGDEPRDGDPADGLPAGSGCKCIISDKAVLAELAWER